MTDKQYKSVDLRTWPEPARPAHYNLRGGAPLEGYWFAEALKTQDGVAASARRLVCMQRMATQELLTVSGTNPSAGSGTQTYPEKATDRIAARSRFHQAAGSILEVRTLALPCGPTQAFADSVWSLDEYVGVIDIDTAWSAQDGSETDTDELLQYTTAGTEQYAGLPTGNGSYWNVVTPIYNEILPTDRDQLDEAEAFSEGTRTTITVQHQGGVRNVRTNISEAPYIHATAHDTLESTAHDFPRNLSLPHPEPRVEAADGTTYDERRFGSHRGLAVVERQQERLGPIIAQWHNYNEGEAVDSTEASRGTTSSTFVGVIDENVTAWGEDEIGFAVPGHYAIPRSRLVVSPRVGLIPVRVWCYGQNETASESGILRSQSSSRSWIDLTISDTLTWYTTTGYLECQRSSDDSTAYANLIPFFRVDSGAGTLRIYAAIWEYGAFDYG